MNFSQISPIPCLYRLSLRAIIKDGRGRILLIQERDDGWELPGGGLEHGESVKVCLNRELAEEIGVKVKKISEKPVGFWTVYADRDPKWFGFVAYEVEITGEPKPGEEADEIRYFNVDEIKDLKLNPSSRGYFLED